MDKWLLSKLNTLVKTVDDYLSNYKITETARALQSFTDDMSNWYVRRCRERFWAKGMEQDKINAYMTLYTALITLSKISAPKVNEEFIDKDLEVSMDEVLDIVVLGRAARNSANIKNRQPIGNMYVKAENVLSPFYVEIIEDELNVKAVEFKDDVEEFVSYSFKPQLKTVGPKYGKLLGKIKESLSNLDGHKAKQELNNDGALNFDFDGEKVVLGREDLLIETAKNDNFVTEADNKVTVVLDIRLDDALLEEGFVRELISKIQTMRKEAGFEVVDHIVLSQSGNDRIAEIIKKNEAVIKNDTLADEIVYNNVEGYTKDWNLNGEHTSLGVSKKG